MPRWRRTGPPADLRIIPQLDPRSNSNRLGGVLDASDFEIEDVFAGGHADDPVGGRAETSPQEPEKPSVRQVSEAEGNERPSDWQAVPALLADLLRVDHPQGANLLTRARQVMLEEIEAHRPGDAVTGAALMGVAPCTFRDWCQAIPPGS